MGASISKWMAKPSTIEVLEKIDEDLRNLRDYEDISNLRYKKYYMKLMMYSSVLTLISCIALYIYLPLSWNQRILAIFGIVTIPLVIWVMINFLKLFYENRKSDSNIKIKELLKQKRDILDNIKATETYKNAIEILEKFDEQTKQKTNLEKLIKNVANGNKHMKNTDLRQRHSATPLNSPCSPNNQSPLSIMPTAIITPPNKSSHPSHLFTQSTHSMTNGRGIGVGVARGRSIISTPRPVLAQTSGYLDRLLEYLIKDGPDYRYALICKNCSSHNGMAMPEEFPYLSFKCAYCEYLNPSQKARPQPPSIEDIVDNGAVSHVTEDTSAKDHEESTVSDVRKKLDFAPT